MTGIGHCERLKNAEVILIGALHNRLSLLMLKWLIQSYTTSEHITWSISMDECRVFGLEDTLILPDNGSA